MTIENQKRICQMFPELVENPGIVLPWVEFYERLIEAGWTMEEAAEEVKKTEKGFYDENKQS